MFRKSLFAATAVLACSSPAIAAKIGGVNIDGWVLIETWNDRHSRRAGQTETPANEPSVFALHNVNFSGAGDLDGGLKYNWKLASRNRNGNFGESGATGWREAYVGLDSEYGNVKVGRMLTKSWEVVDYPYGSPFWLAEATAETGAADWVVTRAIRYQLPSLVDGLDLEGTYDVGQTGASAKARLYELAARYSIGALALDMTYQRKNDSPTTLGVGIYGADGSPSPSSGQSQSTSFLGARYNFGGGWDATIGYKRNEWRNDAGGVLNGFTWNAGRPSTPGTKVSNARLLAGVTYRWDKWRISGALEKVKEGKDNVMGGLDDGATILGVQLARQLSDAGAVVYLGLRHTKFNGTHIPVDSFSWQVQNTGSGASKSNTRLGAGLWIPF